MSPAPARRASRARRTRATLLTAVVCSALAVGVGVAPASAVDAPIDGDSPPGVHVLTRTDVVFQEKVSRGGSNIDSFELAAYDIPGHPSGCIDVPNDDAGDGAWVAVHVRLPERQRFSFIGFSGHGCQAGHSSAGTYDVLWARARVSYILVPGRQPKLHVS